MYTQASNVICQFLRLNISCPWRVTFTTWEPYIHIDWLGTFFCAKLVASNWTLNESVHLRPYDDVAYVATPSMRSYSALPDLGPFSDVCLLYLPRPVLCATCFVLSSLGQFVFMERDFYSIGGKAPQQRDNILCMRRPCIPGSLFPSSLPRYETKTASCLIVKSWARLNLYGIIAWYYRVYFRALL